MKRAEFGIAAAGWVVATTDRGIAKAANLVKPALALVAAWYTGCVSESANAPIVAYDDALMYRPTRDALPVPTYCLGGPAWWTTDPPPLGIAVAAPAPTL